MTRNVLRLVSDNPALYSERLVDTGLARTVRKIRPVPHQIDQFSTFICNAHSGANDEGGVKKSLEAWFNPETNLWDIDAYTILNANNPERAVVQKKQIFTGICFFDALRMLSDFDFEMRNNNPIPVSGDTQHWSVLAKQTGQAVDLDNIVHPCAYRRILVEGNFTMQQMDVAKLSPSPEQDELIPTTAVEKTLRNVAVREESMIRDPDLRRRHAEKYDALIRAGNKLVEHFNNASADNFRNEFGLKISLATLGTNLALLGIYPNLVSFVFLSFPLSMVLTTAGTGAIKNGSKKRYLEKYLAEFEKCASQLPIETDREACLSFAKDIEFAYWMVKAKGEFEKASSGNIQKAEKCVRTAATVKKLDERTSHNLWDEFLKNKGESSYFKLAKDTWFSAAERNHGVDTVKPESGLRLTLEANR